MLWNDLLKLIQSMEDAGHTSMDQKVTIIVDNEEYCIDIFESLTTGNVCFVLATMFEEDSDKEGSDE